MCLLLTATAVSATVLFRAAHAFFFAVSLTRSSQVIELSHIAISVWHQGNRATQCANKNTRLVVWHVSMIWRTRAWCWKASRNHTHMYSYIRVLIACSASVCGMLLNTSCDDKFGSNHPAYIQTNVCQRIQLHLIDAETARVLVPYIKGLLYRGSPYTGERLSKGTRQTGDKQNKWSYREFQTSPQEQHLWKYKLVYNHNLFTVKIWHYKWKLMSFEGVRASPRGAVYILCSTLEGSY